MPSERISETRLARISMDALSAPAAPLAADAFELASALRAAYRALDTALGERDDAREASDLDTVARRDAERERDEAGSAMRAVLALHRPVVWVETLDGAWVGEDTPGLRAAYIRDNAWTSAADDVLQATDEYDHLTRHRVCDHCLHLVTDDDDDPGTIDRPVEWPCPTVWAIRDAGITVEGVNDAQ